MCKSFSPSQIRPLNCGRWVRETRDQRDTTWKMRRDGSRTSLPSPLCRCLHTHAHAHTQYLTKLKVCICRLACVCIRLIFDWQAQCVLFMALLQPSFDPWLLFVFLCCRPFPYPALSVHSFFHYSFLSLYLRCQSWNLQIWWLRFVLDECSPMVIPTILTPSQSTVIVRHTCLQMTCALTCGIWRSQIAALVSFCCVIACSHCLLYVSWHKLS